MPVVATSLNTAVSEIEKSASNSSRSCALLSRPVVSCSPDGIPQLMFVTSLVIARAVPPESSTFSVIPKPLSFAMTHLPSPHGLCYNGPMKTKPILCACGCKQPMPPDLFRYRRPYMLRGHREPRVCGCGCGESIPLMPNQRYARTEYIKGHRRRLNLSPQLCE